MDGWAARWQVHEQPGVWEGVTETGPEYRCQDCYGVDTGTASKRRCCLTGLTPYALDTPVVDHTLEAKGE